ncbi:MAG: hypothetical protein NZ740_06450 [Kiritimatiellae bacterium]|nr:hypothetical protein [Kiritimatiellia bacterium]MDW8458736.1 hypothetical protein [Verrucomicrobiota bacterium]
MKKFIVAMLLAGLSICSFVGVVRAQSDVGGEGQAQLVTEGELAQWLVRVLGLSRFLPAAPTDLECFQILMQNGIMPKDGWQSNRPVTMGNLARVLVLALGKQGDIENPDDDESWISFLKSAGIDFGTIGEAMENLEPLPQPVAAEAVVTATDPLSKLARINPPDDQQGGADFGTLGRVSSPISERVLREVDLPVIEERISRPDAPPRRPPMTPNAP